MSATASAAAASDAAAVYSVGDHASVAPSDAVTGSQMVETGGGVSSPEGVVGGGVDAVVVREDEVVVVGVRVPVAVTMEAWRSLRAGGGGVGQLEAGGGSEGACVRGVGKALLEVGHRGWRSAWRGCGGQGSGEEEDGCGGEGAHGGWMTTDYLMRCVGLRKMIVAEVEDIPERFARWRGDGQAASIACSGRRDA